MSKSKDIVPNKAQVPQPLPQQLTDRQLDVLKQPTPSAFVQERPGRGNTKLSYVTYGYVVGKLNQLFGNLGWDFDTEIVPALTDANFITVRGTLTLKDHVRGWTISKTAFGGSQRKKMQNSSEYVDIADDAKAAAADALKKAASMVGVAFDIYHPKEYATGLLLRAQAENKAIDVKTGEVKQLETIDVKTADFVDVIDEPSVDEIFDELEKDAKYLDAHPEGTEGDI